MTPPGYSFRQHTTFLDIINTLGQDSIPAAHALYQYLPKQTTYTTVRKSVWLRQML